MAVIKKLAAELAAAESDSPEIREKIDTTNLFRIFFLSLVAVPVSIINIVIFSINLMNSGGREHLWQRGIIIAHIGLSVFMLLIGFTARKISDRKTAGGLPAVLTIITSFVLLGFGAMLAAIDQMVTPSITPFLVCCCIVSATLLVKPVHAAALFMLAFIFFQQVMSLVQVNNSIELSNVVNGFAFVVIGMGLSFIIWRTQVKRFEQEVLIHRQTRQIEDNYRKLIEFSDELKESNKTKDKFFSIIAHDLKAPLSAMIGMLEVLRDDTIEVSQEKRAHFLKTLSSSAQNTLKLLENLLLWARNQTGRIEFIPVPTELFPLVQDNISVIHPQSSAKGIAIHNHVGTELMVNANREMLNTVFRNLLSNAVKYTRQDGKVTVEAAPQQGDRPDSRMIKISIADNGIGMAPEILDSLFRYDARGSMRGTNDETGTGLGLIICKEFVERHGGQIYVESTSPSGSVFSFTLPAL